MKYILMHRELPVAILSINDISGTVYRVDDMLQPAHLPTGLYAADRKELAIYGWPDVPFLPAVRDFTVRWRIYRFRKNCSCPPTS